MGFNFTPLIDVMMLLTIFFMLVARFSSAEQVSIQLPHPEQSQGRIVSMPNRVVINCRLSDSPDIAADVAYSIGPNRPEPLSVISDRLAALKARSPGAKVVIRADRRIRYEDVRAVMRLVAGHDLQVLHVAVIAGGTE
jgi:biopolymer transport protein ExbD